VAASDHDDARRQVTRRRTTLPRLGAGVTKFLGGLADILGGVDGPPVAALPGVTGQE
jgi:hypothetical protein